MAAAMPQEAKDSLGPQAPQAVPLTIWHQNLPAWLSFGIKILTFQVPAQGSGLRRALPLSSLWAHSLSSSALGRGEYVKQKLICID